MTGASSATRSVVVEREIAHPPEKVWRALTQSELIGEWLMKAEFKPVVGHRFNFRADWGAVECKVLEVSENETLTYTWGDDDLETVVTWTLTATETGTRLHMVQTGFKQGQPRYYQGAKAGWPRFISNLEQLLERVS